jgi:glutathione S-transferase
MTVTLYDLAGAEPARRFSPYCWRIRMALAHKGIVPETVPWRFTDREAIAFSGQGLVPVLVDGDRTVFDSWAIAQHLERTRPAPSLFGGGAHLPLLHFVRGWTDRILHPAIGRMIIADVAGHLHEKDRAYFRQSREQRFGMALDAISADRDERLPAFRQSLEPVRTVLASSAYLGGESPAYADYLVFGAFQWARCTSAFRLLEEDDPVAAWRERLLDAFGGLARAAPGYD